jgi:hypothetical protein
MILGVGTVGASLVVGALLAAPVAAESPAGSASATAHALDEQANCLAQRRPECPTFTPLPTSTPTPAPTTAPSATAVPAPSLAPPADTPTPEPVPTPCWMVDPDLGDADSGYVVFDETTGYPMPCASAAVAEESTQATESADAPTPTPSQTPTPPSTRPATAVPQRQVIYIQQPPPQPQVVYVQVTAPPRVEYIVPPTITSAPTATPSPSPTRTPTPTRSPPPTATPTPTSTSVVLPTVSPTPVAEPVNSSAPPPPRQPVPVDHVPLPMLPSFGLLAITRKETTLPWLWPLPSSD